MYKAVVSDRYKFKTTEDETRLVQPKELQDIIDKAVSEVKNGKAFVRPSGTEDILRLYCEASTQ
jgi:phosphoacetylglucosamine mutase